MLDEGGLKFFAGHRAAFPGAFLQRQLELLVRREHNLLFLGRLLLGINHQFARRGARHRHFELQVLLDDPSSGLLGGQQLLLARVLAGVQVGCLVDSILESDHALLGDAVLADGAEGVLLLAEELGRALVVVFKSGFGGAEVDLAGVEHFLGSVQLSNLVQDPPVQLLLLQFFLVPPRFAAFARRHFQGELGGF